MKRLFFLCWIFLSYIDTFAQTHLSGRVVNEAGENVSFANVMVENASDSSFVTGTVTKEDGTFEVVASENSLLHVSCLGYRDAWTKALTNQPIVLRKDTILLDEVVVKGSLTPHTYIKDDALITNVKGTYLSKMGNANDVLNRVPGISDRKGSIEVLGKGKAVVYINGRKLRNNDELQEIDARRIKNVSVVFNPGAEYEADANTQAVINLQVSRVEGEGLNFESKTMLGVDKYVYGNEEINLNFASKRLETFAMISYDHIRNLTTNKMVQTGPQGSYLQENNVWIKNRQQNYDGQVGLNYNLDDNQSLGFRYEHIRKPNKTWGNTLTHLISQETEDELEGKLTGDSHSFRNLLNAYYNGNIGKWSLDINADALWYHADGDQLTEESSNTSNNQTVTAHSMNKPRLYAEKIDFARPLWNGSISLGHQFDMTERESSYTNIEGILTNNNTKVEESNLAFYAKLSQRLGKIMAMAGLRAEYVDSRYYEDGIKMDDVSRKYFDLFPTATVILPMGKTIWQMAYSRKIDRPLYSQLSGTVAYINRYTYEGGNPLLKPMYSNNLSLVMKHNWLVLMANYSHLKDKIISTYVKYNNNPNISLLRKDNLDNLDNLQLMAVLSPSFGCYHPTLTGGIIAQWYSVDDLGAEKKLNSPLGIIKWTNAIVLSGGDFINADFSWRSKGDVDNMKVDDTWQINLGISKTISHTWDMKFTCNDLFNTARNTSAIIYSGERRLSIDKKSCTRNFEFTLTYKFNANNKEYRGKNVSEDEINRL